MTTSQHPDAECANTNRNNYFSSKIMEDYDPADSYVGHSKKTMER